MRLWYRLDQQGDHPQWMLVDCTPLGNYHNYRFWRMGANATKTKRTWLTVEEWLAKMREQKL